MKRGRIFAVASALALVVGVAAAWAGAPHLSRASDVYLKSGSGGLRVAATDAVESALQGLPEIATDIVATGVSGGDRFDLTANVVGYYACVNGGGNITGDVKKFAGPKAGGTITVPLTVKNGKFVATVSATPTGLADPATVLSCPSQPGDSGQTATLIGIEFSNFLLSSVDGRTGESRQVPLGPALLCWPGPSACTI